MVGRHEVPIDSDSHPLRQLARELRELRAGAGSPTYRDMAKATGCGASTLSQAASGERLPSAATLRAYVTACGGDVETWESRRQQVAEQQAAAVTPYGPSVAPYRGLARYEPGDSGVYFGRGELVGKLLGVVREHRLTALVGPSGSGKSSLLRAGLIPALRAEPARTRPAAIRVFTPGLRPEDLKAALTCAKARTGGPGSSGALGPGGDAGDTVVIVDQLEELFGCNVHAEQRAEYARMLLAALEERGERGGRLRLVVGIRADSFPDCVEHAGLAAALRDSTVHVPPMGPAELREVVVKPAAAAGLIVERSLTARILREAGGEPGCLPLVSHALLETWQRRRGRTLTEAMYEAAGGIRGAIATTAEELYGRLIGAEAPAARRVLLRLVTPGENGAGDTVRLADRAEFGYGGRAAHTALEALVAARLVTMDGDTVALAHEAMIAAWPRLSRWIDEERERLRLHRRLTDAAATWRALGDDPEALYRGGRLSAAEAAFPGRARVLELTTSEREFLVAGCVARDREKQAASQVARRVRVLSLSLVLVLVLALTGGLTAAYWSKESGRQRRDAAAARRHAATTQRVATSQELASQADALSATYPDLAGLLAVSAYRTYPTDEALGSLQQAAAQPLRRRLAEPLPAARVDRLAFSADGRSLAGGSGSGAVGVWDLDTGRLRTVPDQDAAPAAAVAFTPDSAGLLVDRAGGGLDTYGAGTVAPTGAHVTGPAAALTVLSADGRTQASAGGHGPVTVRDAATGRVRATLPVPYGVTALAASGDGTTVAAAGGDRITVWDARTGHVLRTLADNDDITTLVLDGPAHTVLAQGRHRIRIWDVPSGHEWMSVPSDCADGLPFTAPALSPDGRIAAGGAGHTAWEWDVRAGTVRATLTGHKADITAVSFTADGRSVATGDAAGEVRVWDVPPRAAETTCPGGCDATAVSADGSVTALASGGQARVYAPGSGGGSRTVPGTGGGTATALALDTHGGTLAVAGPGGRVRLVDLATGRTRTLAPAGGTVPRLRFSPDGRTLAALVGDQAVRTWNLRTGATGTSERAGAAKLRSLAFSPDGRTLAAGDAAGGVRLWESATLRPTGQLSVAEPGGVPERDSMGLAFSPDGRSVAAGTAEGKVQVWDLATSRPRTLSTGRATPVSALAYSADGAVLAGGSTDGTTLLWDPATGGVRGMLLATGGQGMWLAFASGDGTLFTGGQGVPLGRWQPRLPDATGAMDRVCTAVGRELTTRERGDYLTEGAAPSGCGAAGSSGSAGSNGSGDKAGSDSADGSGGQVSADAAGSADTIDAGRAVTGR